MDQTNKIGLSRYDKIIVLLSTLMASVFAYFLVNENILVNYFLPPKMGNVSVGEVTQAQNDVRRKLQKSITWYKINNDETVFEGDSLFSGEDSEIIVELSSGLTVNVGSNSLVVLKKQDKEFVLDLQVGEVSAESKGNDRLTLLQDGQQASIDLSENAKLSLVKSKSGAISLASMAGQAVIKSGENTKTIKDNVGVSIDAAMKLKEQKFPIKLKYPEHNEKTWKSFLESMDFTWSSTEFEQDKFRLEFSSSAGFKDIFYTQESIVKNVLVKELPLDRKFYWRVVALKEGNIISQSKVRKLTVRSATPVELVYPTVDGKVDLKKQASVPVSLEWVPRKLKTSYVVHVSNDQHFGNLIVNKQTKSFRLTESLAQGVYFWRVRILADRVNTSWSDVRSFTIQNAPVMAEEEEVEEEEIEEEKEPEKPEVVEFRLQNKSKKLLLKFNEVKNPRDLASVQSSLQNPPNVVWPKQKEAEYYRVQVTSGKSFAEKFIDETIKKNSYKWMPDKAGVHYWRVKALDKEKNELTKWSKPQKLSLVLPVHEFSKKSDFKNLVKSPSALKDKHKFKLSWNPVPLANYYLTEISPQEDFSKKKQLVSQGNRAVISLKDGEYFVRGYVLNDQKRIVSSTTPTKKIKLSTSLDLKSPELVLPDHQMSIVTFGKNFEPLLFSWSEVKHTKVYRVQFSKTRKFDKILFETEQEEPSFLMTEKQDKGMVYWRVRAEYGKSKSKWSKVRSFEY